MSKASSLNTAAGWRKAGPLHVEARLEALGFRHGVTTRALGDMKDGAARARAAQAAGLRGEPLILRQVHGTGVVETGSVSGSPGPRAEADGWVTAERGKVPAVYVADCLPVFVWDSQGSAAGVFHAGWRGLASGMPRAAVRAFRRFGIGPERLEAAVGPHVGACCYTVGPEVAAKFRAEVVGDGKLGPAKHSSPDTATEENRLWLDLGAEAALQLAESGLAAGRVSVSAACTACSPDEFFSYRREKLDQRMLAFIALPEPSHGT